MGANGIMFTVLVDRECTDAPPILIRHTHTFMCSNTEHRQYTHTHTHTYAQHESNVKKKNTKLAK